MGAGRNSPKRGCYDGAGQGLSRRVMGTWWIGLSLLMLSAPLFSQPGMLRFEHIGADHGLSHQTVTSIFQDRWGYVWFGTIDGLNRFDGYRCKVYKHDPNDPTSISSSFIHGMMEDQHGNLWIGTRDGGLSVLTPEGRKTGQFERVSIFQSDPGKLNHERVESFYVDSEKRLWAGTQAGVALFDDQAGRFVEYGLFSEIGEAVLVSQFLEDHSSHLWMVTTHGLFKLDLGALKGADPDDCGDLVTRYQHDPDDPESLSTPWIRSLFQDRAGRFWVGTRNNGISEFNPSTGKCKHYRHDPEDPGSLANDSASVLYQDSEGLLWIGTDGGGLNIFDPSTGRFKAYRHLPNRSQSISHNNINRVFQSNDGITGSIWVATWGGGVNKLIEPRKPFELFRHDPENDNSLGSNFVLAIMEDREGLVWIGSSVVGISRLNPSTGKWWRFSHREGDTSSLGHNTVWSIIQDHSGQIWVTTESGGLNKWVPGSENEGGRFVRYQNVPERPGSVLENDIKVVFEDRDGYLWLGYQRSGGSRARFDVTPGGAWRHFRHLNDDPHSIADDSVRCFEQDRFGNIWVGTFRGGVARVDGFDDQGQPRFTNIPIKGDPASSLNHGDVRDLHEGADGGLWAATFGGGLDRIDLETGAIRHFTTADGLSNDFVYGLLDDGLGHLWISTNRGLNQFDYDTETFTLFGTQHGLQSDEFNTGAFFANGNGDLYFGGVNGFNRFNPGTLMERLALERTWVPPVRLTQFEAMGEARALGVDFVRQKPISLKHSDQFFAFEMAVLDYHNPAKNRFRYRLDGFDHGWIDNGNRRFASYTNLDPGTYTLHYEGANHTGVWHEGSPLTVVIAAPFWGTWWFRSLMVLLVILLVLIGLRVKHYYQTYRSVKYVAHFKILRKLGQGGAGTVYLAKDRLSKKQMALKVLHSDLQESHDGIRRFLQEAEIGSRLRHPHIVQIYEAGNFEQTRYLCMEYLEGQTLKEHLDENGPLALTDTVRMATQILSGLQAIHEQGIVHRDLKAANLMVLPNGHIKIMDFGLARIHALTTVENRNQLMGTLSYMSPEQTLGKGVDRRSDIYAFGAILHQLVFGSLPFEAQNEMEMIYAIHNETPLGLATLGAEHRQPIHGIVAKCLAKDPEDRYQDVAEVLAAFDALGLGQPPGSKAEMVG